MLSRASARLTLIGCAFEADQKAAPISVDDCYAVLRTAGVGAPVYMQSLTEAEMSDPFARRLYYRFRTSVAALTAILIVGTIGYLHIGGESTSTVDAFYMTFITIATIGYGEIIDMTGKPGARIFTMLIALAGIGVSTYILSTLTAFIVQGDMNQVLRRRKMQNSINKLFAHYIVCGVGRVGSNVAHELAKTGRPYVVIDADPAQIRAYSQRNANVLHWTGDASEDDVLEIAGVTRAAGVFAVTGDDSRNLVITLTAKQMNPACRVVARCHELNYFTKMSKVGADAIVSPDFTGGMRIASSMIRPHVVSFLDEMLRSDNNVRVEEVHVGADKAAVAIGDAAPPSRDYIVLAVRSGAETIFNPPPRHKLLAGQVLVVMASPEGRHALEAALN